MEDKKRNVQKKPSEAEMKEQRILELTQLLKKVQAEFENYKKRTDAERSACIKASSRSIITQLLPILDNFELALKNVEKEDDFTKGIELIYAQLFSTLQVEGLKAIDALNKPFDPYYHEALMQDNNRKLADNIITEEFQKGYLLNDEVIRPSKVKVNRRKKDDNKE